MSKEELPGSKRLTEAELRPYIQGLLAAMDVRSLKHHESIADAQLRSIVQSTRIRLGGFDPEGKPLDDWGPDIRLLGDLEKPFTNWLTKAKAEAAVIHDSHRDEDGMTTVLRGCVDTFHREGGHTSAYTEEDIRFIMEHGIVAFIELKIREDLWVTIGAVSGLSSNPLSKPDSDPSTQRFPQFDLRDLPITDPDLLEALEEVAATSWLTCRSTMLPSTDHPFLQTQLQGQEMPDGLHQLNLQRLGLPSKAKAVAFLIAQKFGNQFATSNIGSIKMGAGVAGWKNIPSTNFNDWMMLIGERKSFRIRIDEGRSRLRLALSGYISVLSNGIDALIGEQGIATKKGHDIASIRADAEQFHTGLIQSIASGQHAPWGSLKDQ